MRYPLSTCIPFLATYATPPGDPSHRHFTILGGGEPVGSFSIRPGFQPQRGDIGYWVGIPHQRKGYATAAVQEALRRLRQAMGRGGGFILSPAKELQPETPTENAAAVVDAFLSTD